MLKLQIDTLADLDKAAQKLIIYFPDSRIFAFYGEMGAGKTTFIQSLCKVLGSDDNVISPTFSLINEYTRKNSDPIFHFDFYRIKNIEEAYNLGYEDYFYSENYCLIEWPEKIESLLPEQFVKVKIFVTDNESRNITAIKQ